MERGEHWEAVMCQLNGDKMGRKTTHPIPIGDYMEVKTTFKCAQQRIIIDKGDNKSKAFHDFTEHYDPVYHLIMINFIIIIIVIVIVIVIIIIIIKFCHSAFQRTNNQNDSYNP
eukprot:2665785-Amphidinium_carterae.1